MKLSKHSFFSTTTDEDETRGWGKTITFKLKRTNSKPDAYKLFDNKKTKSNQDRKLVNELIYEMHTVDNFTTAMLTHLLVRKIAVGKALIAFEEQIAKSPFKDSDIMKQFYKKNTAAGSLQEALDKYRETNSLDDFFANHSN